MLQARGPGVACVSACALANSFDTEQASVVVEYVSNSLVQLGVSTCHGPDVTLMLHTNSGPTTLTPPSLRP
jgi:hypothetical protein